MCQPVSGFSRSTRDEELAALLAAGFTVAESAADVGLSERQVYRKLQREEFRQRVDEIRSAFVRQADGKIRAAMTRAADVLAALLDSPIPSVRFKAASELARLGYASFAGRGAGR